MVSGASYNATWHFHPEYQITLVIRSSGYRLVGDKITPLRSGDLVLVGSNLPHVWQQENQPQAQRKSKGGSNTVQAIVVRFLSTCFGPQFLEIPEAASIKRLLKRASRGLHVTGKTRDIVSEELESLPSKQGLSRVAKLLVILDLLARSNDLNPIASHGFVQNLSTEDQSRMGRVINYIHDHFDDDIDRAKVAAEACLSEGAFSRFFKQRTGKTLPEYVNELRVGRACRMLAEEHRKVTDVALECGFRNLANFNRRFRKITNQTPSSYREQLRRSVEGR